jgi:hypothetical protein
MNGRSGLAPSKYRQKDIGHPGFIWAGAGREKPEQAPNGSGRVSPKELAVALLLWRQRQRMHAM